MLIELQTAGTLVGNCIDPSDSEDSSYNGIAYGARIAVFDIGVAGDDVELAMPDDLRDIFSPSYFAGARIHSNSWGGSYWYDSYALETDAYAYENPDFLAFFAGGNDGAERSVLSPALSKNAVGVAGSNQFPQDTMASYSSWGPAFDGRIKPDITTPGTNVYSANAEPEGSTLETCALRPSSGTSMATPAAAASAALIRQYFQDPSFWAATCNKSYEICTTGSFSPSGYLLKALLLHSGVGIITPTGNVPDQHQGYGLINLYTLLPLRDSKFQLFVDDASLTEFTQISYQVQVYSSAAPLKVTLSWFDPPNEVFAAKVLLHDLDLLLVNPSGQTLLGNSWTTNGKPFKGATRDELNNNEQVTVDYPAVGTWTAIVQAKLLSESNAQMFALVITGIVYVSREEEAADASDKFGACSYTQGGAAAELGVSLMEFVNKNGWNPNSKYIISLNESIAVSGTLRPGLFYEYDYICLTTNTYDAQLLVSANIVAPMFIIPSCDLFLAPLKIADIFNYEASTLGFESKCTSSCQSSDDFISLSILLFEGGCGGWSGAYFAVHDLNSSDGDGVSGGTLEWDCLAEKQVCLSASEACYIIQLQIPFQILDDDYDPILLLTDTASPSCPWYLSSEATIAKLCVHSDLVSGTMVFYNSSTQDIRSEIESWPPVFDQMINSEPLGSCELRLTRNTTATISPTQAPSVALTPSRLPSTWSPSIIPSSFQSFSPSREASSAFHSPTPTTAPTVLRSNANASEKPLGRSSLPSYSPGNVHDRTVIPTSLPSSSSFSPSSESPDFFPNFNATDAALVESNSTTTSAERINADFIASGKSLSLINSP